MGVGRVVLLLFFINAVYGSGLDYEFYERSCPQVESIVRRGLATMFLADPSTPAALLRLMFHDCQVQGCDASILLDSKNMTSEIDSNKNFGLRKRELIGIIKSMIEAECPRTVSCADIIVLAAREAVASSGGPWIRVPLGRRDALTSTNELADAYLPPSNTGVDDMLRIFGSKGMTREESVAILGAHTLGISHCINIQRGLDREQAHPERMNSNFLLFLELSCPTATQAAKSAFLPNDLTAFIFDNQYFMNSIRGEGLLRIDSELSMDPRTAPIVGRFASDQYSFFQAFKSAFIKLSSSHVLVGNQGRVLSSCNGVK